MIVGTEDEAHADDHTRRCRVRHTRVTRLGEGDECCDGAVFWPSLPLGPGALRRDVDRVRRAVPVVPAR